MSIKLVAAAVATMMLSYITYTTGYRVAQGECSTKLYTIQSEITEKYKAQLQNYAEQEKQLEQSITAYRNRLDAVHADADALRMQLRAAESDRERAMQEPAHQSQPAPKCECGRDPKMAGVLAKCTALAEERDQIALYYNELRSQCHLK